MFYHRWWLDALVITGFALVPVLLASLWIPDAIEKVRARNARILAEREARR